MGTNLNLDLRLGSGGGAPFTNPAIPAVDNIVRCWSLRRNVPAYKKGAGIRELRASGGSENDVLFGANGLLSISGADAFANVLYDQKGNADSKLLQGTFTSCPKVFESNVVLKGLSFDGTDYLIARQDDELLETCFLGNTHTMAVWFNCLQTGSIDRTLCGRVSTSAGYQRLAVVGGKVRAYINSAANYINSENSFNDGNWHLAVVTKSGAVSTPNGSKLYVDGVLEGTDEIRAVSSAKGRFAIGANSAGGNPLTGSINDVMVWNVALSLPEIVALYNAQKGYYEL